MFSVLRPHRLKLALLLLAANLGLILHLASGELKPVAEWVWLCLLYTSPSPRDQRGSRMPSSA